MLRLDLTAKTKLLGAAAICVAAVLWGLDGVVLTPRLYNLDVHFVVFMLHLIPFVLMQPWLGSVYRQLPQFTPADWITFILIAITGGVLGTLAIVKALFLVNFVNLSVVVLLQKLQPVFAILLARIVLKETLRPRFLAWAAVAVGASYLLTFGFRLPNFQTSANTVAAALWALLAAAAFGSATVLGRKALLKHSFTTTTFYRFGFTTVLMLGIVLGTGNLFPFPKVTPLNWSMFFIIAVTTGSGAIFLYYFGLKKVRAMVATICELCYPMSAILFDYLVNDYVLSGVQLLGVALLVLSILKISIPRPASLRFPSRATRD